MILSRKRRPGEIAEIERLHLGRAGVSVLQRFLAGLYRERTEIAIRERAKRSLPDADDSYWSHAFRITRTFRILNPAREQAVGYLWLNGTTVGPGLRWPSSRSLLFSSHEYSIR